MIKKILISLLLLMNLGCSALQGVTVRTGCVEGFVAKVIEYQDTFCILWTRPKVECSTEDLKIEGYND